jgi:hypothetical protein
MTVSNTIQRFGMQCRATRAHFDRGKPFLLERRQRYFGRLTRSITTTERRWTALIGLTGGSNRIHSPGEMPVGSSGSFEKQLSGRR